MTNLTKSIIMIISVSIMSLIFCSCSSDKSSDKNSVTDDIKRIGNDIKNTGEDIADDIAEGITGNSMGDSRDSGMNYSYSDDNKGQINTTNGAYDGGTGDAYPDTDFAPDSANDTASGINSETPGGSTGSSHVTK